MIMVMFLLLVLVAIGVLLMDYLIYLSDLMIHMKEETGMPIHTQIEDRLGFQHLHA